MTPLQKHQEQACIQVLRSLSLDMIERANSGHPGLPLGCAPAACAIFSRFLKFDPQRPAWIGRDRFVLSAGHGSALLYALLHTFGYKLEISDLEGFRQWGSITPGHPEFGVTPGVEVTTGPLGQGFANSVGIAIGERFMSARYNKPEHPLASHFTYCLCSDGDLMEGVALEAASLAGHQQLGKLICLYDDNSITLDGPRSLSFSEDVPAKFAAMEWHVQTVANGEDIDAVSQAIEAARQETGRPSLIAVKTVIGFGSPVAGKKNAHSFPWPEGAVAETRQTLGITGVPFESHPEVEAVRAMAQARGAELSEAWDNSFAEYSKLYPELAQEIEAIAEKRLPSGWREHLASLDFAGKKLATRESGGMVLNALAEAIPWLVGGAADLTSSTKTVVAGSPAQSAQDPSGRNIYFGVREHGMGAIVNGLTASGLLAFGSTFLVFSDYMRGAIRLASLSHLPSLFIFTHDSVFVGEDGPTHEPIEHVMALRAIPGLFVYRPADSLETRECYISTAASRRASAFALTRQALPELTKYAARVAEGAAKGAYILEDPQGAQVTLLASGSEVHLALDSAAALAASGVACRVVSMPCWELFRAQDPSYRQEVLGHLPRISIEAGITLGWHEWVGESGIALGIDRFGASASGELVYRELGMSVEAVTAAAMRAVAK